MTEPVFRPRGAIEIIDAAIRLYRANLGALVTVSVVLLVPFSVIGAATGPVGKLLMSFAQGLITPIVVAVIVGIVDDVLHGRPADTSAAFARLRGKVGLLIGVAIASGLLMMLGFVLLVVPGLLALAWFLCAPMAVVVEGVDGVGNALSRSRALAKGHVGHVLLTAIIAWAGLFLLSIALGATLGIAGTIVSVPQMVLDIFGAVLFAVLFPVVGVASTLLYFDLRVRSDAYDVESMIADLPPTPVVPGAGAPGAAPGSGPRAGTPGPR